MPACACPHIDGYRIRARACPRHAEKDAAYWQSQDQAPPTPATGTNQGAALTDDERADLLRAWPWPKEAATTETGFADVCAAVERIVAAARADERAEVAAESVTFPVGNWPTPNHCRRVADALDAITPARYGDILRAYADAEDARLAAHGPIAHEGGDR